MKRCKSLLFGMLAAVAILPAFSSAGGRTSLPVAYGFEQPVVLSETRLFSNINVLARYDPARYTFTAIARQDPPPASSPWAFAVYYSLSTKQPAAVVMSRVGTLEDVLGLHFNLEAQAFAGVSSGGVPAGSALTFPIPLARRLTLHAGFAIEADLRNPSQLNFRSIRGGVIGGLEWTGSFVTK